MAVFVKSHPSNTPGSVFVDTTCIDCETCFHLAPTVFSEYDGQSIVHAQPESLNDWSAVKRSIVSCPTNSIGTKGAPAEFKEAALDLPLPIVENISYCGYTSRDSYGATTYFIQRVEGNILIDSPKFHPHLVKELEERGGVSLMILTHRDDVADHHKFQEHFSLKRVIHADEVTKDTEDCEIILQTEEAEDLDQDLKIIKVPGHTKGHIVILYRNKYLFTGDHLFVDGPRLLGSRSVCWYSWEKQIESTRKLLQYSFEWVLPGHGGWGYFPSEEKNSALASALMEMTAK